MADVGAQAASSSRCSYHVFLSFRGEDTRNTFTDHLYTALFHAGIRTFRDDDGLERGHNIARDLNKAIQESRISIVVFSKDHASSRWCLDELLSILEQKKTVGHMILPIFYHVDPSHVRKQTGSFAEALATHEVRFKAEIDERKEEGLDKLKRWKTALTEVANLAGMVLMDGQESTFIQKIVEDIGNKLNRTALSVGPYPTGIESRVKDINLWIQDGSTDVGIVTICGMGGIGKTTIAKTVYNLNFDRFEGSSFLANIRELSEQPNGLVSLQKRLLLDILKGRKEKISSVDEGIIKLRNAICCKRVLLVLDDVDQSEQLNAVLVMRDWFCPGSKIVITTRHEQLLKAHKLHKMYKVKELNDDESLQLFCWHAFGQDHPTDAYLEHSKKVVHNCGGLPLALQVLGSSLSGSPVDVWESRLKKLEAIPESQILKKLKTSFDSLQDDHDRNLFLDIACFFVRKDKDFTTSILDGCGFYTKVGIHNLIDRCLIIIDENNKLTMHQLLRDMGREIIRQESPKEPEKRSRLWHHKDAFGVLNEKTGTESIEGLILNLNVRKEDRSTGKFMPTFVSEDNPSKRRRSLRNKEKVKSCLQLEPIGNFDEVMVQNLGLSYMEFPENTEVSLFNSISATNIKVPLQGLYEFGIFSTSFPGSEVPGWFSIKGTGSTICFKVPSFHNVKIQGLNVCIVYAKTDGDSDDPRTKYGNKFYLKVRNRTKDLKWIYSPTLIGAPEDGKDMVWLSQWNFMNQLEKGDEMSFSVSLLPSISLKEFGINVVFEKVEKGTPSNTAYPCDSWGKHCQCIKGAHASTSFVAMASTSTNSAQLMTVGLPGVCLTSYLGSPRVWRL